MNILKKGNWGLRLLALILAVILYHALKTESALNGRNDERSIFNSK